MNTTPRSRARIPVTLLLLSVVSIPPAGAQLTTLGSQYFDQDSSGIEGEAEADDLFGGALATGDFNCDGIADLAIGVPYEDVQFDCNNDGTADPNECGSAGAVNVIYGSAQGLHPSAGHADQILTQATSGVPGSPEYFDHFGYAVAAIRRPLGSCDDLAVGVPDEDVNDGPLTHVDAGIVNYFRGTTAGLVADGEIVQGREGVPERPEDGDKFGYEIAQGPMLKDDACPGHIVGSIAIGAPGEGVSPGTSNGEGIVILVVTTPCNLPGLGSGDLPDFVTCGSSDDPCQYLAGDGFPLRAGEALAAGGRFSQSSAADAYLAIGVPDDYTSATDAGTVQIWGQSSTGASMTERDFCDQESSGAPGSAESGDHLGKALTAGDFDGDGLTDLAAGVPYENVNNNSVSNGGAVSVFYSAPHSGSASWPTGLGPPAGQFFDQDSLNSSFTAETSDHFGAALANGDFDGDGNRDLAIGVPDENVDGSTDAGSFHVLYGGTGGLSVAAAQGFTLASGALPGDPQSYDHLGYALSAGDFDGDGKDDLAVATPGERITTSYGGGVFVLYGGRPSSALCNLVLSVPDITPAESAGTITVSVERTDNAILPIDFHYDWSNSGSTATGGVDFQDFSGTLSWSAGQKGVKTFQVQLLDDTLAENPETLAIDSFESPNVCDGPATLVLTIQNNDVAGSMQFQNACASAAEIASNVTINVTRSGGAASGVTVHYATSDGSATADADYTSTSGTLTFGAGQTTRSFSIPVLADTADENALESIKLTLSSPGGFGTLGTQAIEVLTILDNDGPNVLFANNFECGNAAGWSAIVP